MADINSRLVAAQAASVQENVGFTAGEFIIALRTDYQDAPIHFRLLPPKGAPEKDSRWNTVEPFASNASDLKDESFSDDLMQAALKGCARANELSVYFVVNPGGTDDKDITHYCAAFVESDTATIAEQHARLNAAPLLTSARIETAKSVHAYWFLKPGCTETEWREIQKRLIAFFDGDKSIKNPSRIMRMPGFDHTKLVNGVMERKPVRCDQLNPERRYTAAEMLTAFPAPVQQSSGGLIDLSLAAGNVKWTESEDGKIYEGDGRNAYIASIAGRLRRYADFSEESILLVCKQTGFEKCNPPLEDNELEKIVKSVFRYQPETSIESAEGSTKPAHSTGIGMKWGEMLNIKLELPDFITHGLARGQVGQLIAKPNIGKTKLLRNLALSLASGKPYLHLTNGGKPYRVAYFDLEELAAIARHDLKKMAQELDPFENELVSENLFYSADAIIDGMELSLANPFHLELIRAELAVFKPDFIIVDTLAKAFPGIDENSNNEMLEKAMTPLGTLARQFNAAVLFAHHSGKRGSDGVDTSGVYGGRGASSIAGFVRTGYMLDTVTDKGKPKYIRLSAPKIKGRHLPDLNLTLDTTGEDRWFKPICEGLQMPTEAGEYQKVVKALAEAIQNSEEKKISRKAGIALSKVSETTFDKHVESAVKVGWLVKEEAGKGKPVFFALSESLANSFNTLSNVVGIETYRQNPPNAYAIAA